MVRKFESVVGEAVSVLDNIVAKEKDKVREEFLTGHMRAMYGDNWKLTTGSAAEKAQKKIALDKLATKYKEVKDVLDYMNDVLDQLESAGSSEAAKAAALDEFELTKRRELYGTLKRSFA